MRSKLELQLLDRALKDLVDKFEQLKVAVVEDGPHGLHFGFKFEAAVLDEGLMVWRRGYGESPMTAVLKLHSDLGFKL